MDHAKAVLGPTASWTILDPTLVSRRQEVCLDCISAIWDLHGNSPSWNYVEESTAVSGRMDVIYELPNQKPHPREQKQTPRMGFFPGRRQETTRWTSGVLLLPQFLKHKKKLDNTADSQGALEELISDV